MKPAKLMSFVLAILFMGAITSGCVERRYYREHHDHSPRYYERHPRPRVDVNIHN